jgi:Trypsin
MLSFMPFSFRTRTLRGCLALALGAAGCAPAGDEPVPAGEAVGHEAQAISFGIQPPPGSPIARSTLMFLSAATEGKHGCSASLIDESHALTAGHCARGTEGISDLVLLFATAYSPDAPTRPVTATFIPPGYPFNGGADIGVIEFSGGVPAGYTPAVLVSNAPVAPGTKLIHAGFGQSTSTVNDRGILRAGRGHLVKFRNAPAPVYDASGDSSSICSGDSGGPDYLTVSADGRLRQIGVHVSGGCDLEPTSSSTDVRANIDWIRSTGARPLVD